MIYKACLVARGFEEENLNNICKNSPTCCKDNFSRLVLSVIVSNSWIIHSLDIKSPFLQGKKIDRDVYLKPPKETDMEIMGIEYNCLSPLWCPLYVVYNCQGCSHENRCAKK